MPIPERSAAAQEVSKAEWEGRGGWQGERAGNDSWRGAWSRQRSQAGYSQALYRLCYGRRLTQAPDYGATCVSVEMAGAGSGSWFSHITMQL